MEGIQKFRYNAMGISDLRAFANVKGGMNHECKDVYFIRAVGVNHTYLADVARMDQNLTNQMNDGKGYYNRIDSLPKFVPAEDAEYYSGCYDGWVEHDRKDAETRATYQSAELKAMLGSACREVVAAYSKSTGVVTPSMGKNLIVKMLFWYDFIFSDAKFHWNPRLSAKIVFSNIEKKHEYLFCYLVTRMGCDVLLLQSRKDIGDAEESLQLSQKINFGACSDVTIPPYLWSEPKWPGGVGTAGQINLAVPARSGETRPEPLPARMEAADRARPGADRTELTPAGMETADRARLASGRDEPGADRGRPLPDMTESLPRQMQPFPGRAEPVQSQAQPVPEQQGSPRREKSFEELAQLASSVVLIAVHNQKGEVVSSGSGIMIGQDGYILTNNHVANGGRYYSVRIEDDEQTYTTDEVIKYHSVLDLAIIRIQRRLVPLPIYQGRGKLVRGQKVVAIGSPLGLFNSVSDGIISGFRKIDTVDMIQFTAPISHGSSGGAVLNMYGEVIGISTAGFDNGQNINLAMGYECINLFIKGFV